MPATSGSTARLKRINADTSWLLTLPSDSDYATSTYNILIDPWLDAAEQVDFARSFSAQQRVTPALAASVAELEDLIANDVDEGSESASSSARPPSRQVDAIILSHPFTDHAHPETLLDPSLPRHFPLLVTSDAYKVLPMQIKEAAKTGERKVHKLDLADPKLAPALVARAKGEPSERSDTYLPGNIAILQTRPHPRMPAFLGGPPALASQQLHGGVFFMWTESDERKAATEDDQDTTDIHAILYTPHGSVQSSVPAWLSQPPIKPCAILTSLDRIVLPSWISGTVNLGLPGALQLMLAQTQDKSSTAPFAARHLIDTHGEHKTKQGLVASLMRRYYLGDEADEISCTGKDPKEKAGIDEKEAKRQSEAQRLVDAAYGNHSAASVQCLGVGDVLDLP